tara:strand:+ start:18779 stop:19000 length:222 start_codon:yes stop_codon:yes gene_type:complete
MPDIYDMDLDARPDDKLCSICSEIITTDIFGWDGCHNASPINNGVCCSYCNSRIVEPTRFIMTGFPIPNNNKN